MTTRCIVIVKKPRSSPANGKTVPRPTYIEPEAWRFSWQDDADGERRFHCPICHTTCDDAVDARNRARAVERRWPRTRLAQETLRLATELAQEAWLVDQLDERGEPIVKALVPRLREIHRASMKNSEHDDLRLVLAYVTNNRGRFLNAIRLRDEGTRGYPRSRTNTDAERFFQIITEQFLEVYERSFGPVHEEPRVRACLERLWTDWPNKGGRGSYVPALRALWLALRGNDLGMSVEAIHKFAAPFRAALKAKVET